MGKSYEQQIIYDTLSENGPTQSDKLTELLMRITKRGERTVKGWYGKLYLNSKVSWFRRHPEDWTNRGDVWYYLEGQEEILQKRKKVILISIPVERVDDVIVDSYIKSKTLPSFEEAANELIVDPQNTIVRQEIFSRLSKIGDIKTHIEKILERDYTEPSSSDWDGKKGIEWIEAVRDSIEKKFLKDKEIIEKLGNKVSDIHICTLKRLIRICKENFKDKQFI